MSKHTPGPWKFEDEYVRTASGELIADPYCRPTAETRPGEMESNAVLIAAAPELLAALQGYLIATSGNGDPVAAVAEEAARAALAKATGTQS